MAARSGRFLALHVDEALDPRLRTVEGLGALPVPVTASHCVALSVQHPQAQRRTAQQLAAAQVPVVVNPATNLSLQARGVRRAPPRGLTAVAALREAGVTLTAGGDNVQDPFHPLGRADPLQTAGLLVVAGHVPVVEALAAVSTAAHRTLGVETCGPVAGARADLVAVRAGSAREAVAQLPTDRLVWRAGRLVAATVGCGWDHAPA